MSESVRWKRAINQLMENLNNEFEPLDENLKEKGLKFERADPVWFEFYAALYVKYVSVYKELEECYERLTHPQRRVLLREMIEANALRIFELKEELVRYSTVGKTIRSDFVSLDTMLSELKIRHQDVAMHVPRYYSKDYDFDRYKRNQLVDKFLVDLKDTDAPEEEQIVQICGLDSDLDSAMRMIQKLERGRQGIFRVMRAFHLKKKDDRKQERKKLEGDGLDDDGDGRKQLILSIQKAVRGYLTRKKVRQLRQEEMSFLGIAPNKDVGAEMLKLKEKQNEKDKIKQEKDRAYRQQIQKMREGLLQKWQQPMKDKMLVERRQWIGEFLEKNQYHKVPNTVKEFYQKDKVKVPLSPEEEELEAKLAEQKKKQKKGKKKKKLSERDEFLLEHTKGGPSAAVQKLQEQVQKHTSVWGKAPEGEGPELSLVKEQIIPKVEEQVRNMVDDMIELQLANLRIKLKKKKGKSKKKKKKKKAKAIKVPGWKEIQKIPPLDQIGHLVDFGVLKKLAPASIKDFIGEPNLMRPKEEQLSQLMPDPSMWDLRQVVVQSICLPLGSQYIRQNISKLHYFLFFGPIGSGKTLMVRAIASECDAIVLQLSPMTLEAKINQKKQLNKMIAMTFNVAKTFAPAIIYMDEIQQIFKAKKKKKKGAPPAGPNFTKLRKTLTKYKKKVLKKDDRVAVIGCTNKPWDMNKKFIKPFVQKKYYFPFPNYATRKALFEYFMEKKGVKLPQTFPVTTIAHVTEGCTAGNFRQAIGKVANERRLAQLNKNSKGRPFQVSQFIGPIASQPSTYIEEYEKFREFNDEITGLKARRDKLAQLLSGEQPEDKKKGSKPAKKK